MINIFPERPTAPVFSSSSKFFPKVVNDMPDFTVYSPEDHSLLIYHISHYITLPYVLNRCFAVVAIVIVFVVLVIFVRI
jgi:hypothetical protein